MSPHLNDCQRKRLRERSAYQDIEEQPGAKRRKAISHDYPPEFWNALSKIKLTRKAVKEFDRQTTEEKTISAVGATKRSTRLLRSDAKKLPHFAENGGPNLDHLRGYANLPRSCANMSKSSSRKGKRTRDSGLPSSEFTEKTSTTGPYDSQFQQMAIDNKIYPQGYRMADGSRPPKPNNFDAIVDQLHRYRPSTSPSQFSETAFEEFQDRNNRAHSEAKAMSDVIPIITGARDNQFETEEGIKFNNMEKFAPALRIPQPSKSYGARPEQINPSVRRDLDRFIIPSTRTALPAAPNFFFEDKSAVGRPDVAQRQVMNDNAYGARGMWHLQNYGRKKPVYDGNAYTLGSTYHPGTGTLQIYATHPRQSATGGTEYHETQLNSYGMTGNIEACRRGIAAFRNSRDFTQERRDHLIANANAMARTASTDASSSRRTDSRTGSSSAMANNSFGSDTSTDVLAKDSSASGVQASNNKTPAAREQARDELTDSADDDHVTADGEQDEDEDEDNDGKMTTTTTTTTTTMINEHLGVDRGDVDDKQ